MQEIILKENLIVGERTVVMKGREPYKEYDFFAKKGEVIRKHSSGRVEVYKETKTGQIASFPIDNEYLQQIVWIKAKKQWGMEL